MSRSVLTYNWSDLAFSSKKSVNNLDATFIAASRELSQLRFKQLIKEYLPQGNIVLGISKEPYVEGFENQPQFKMLEQSIVQPQIDMVNAKSKSKIVTLSYFQRELKYILEKFDFKKVVFINGSWKYSFHTQTPYYVLVNTKVDFEMISPFTSENEAKDYDKKTWSAIKRRAECPPSGSLLTESEMIRIAQQMGQCSYDYNFQTGISLGRENNKKKYVFLAAAFNKVVPYQTFAMHFGASRERHFSPPHDLNHYDTVHAEVELLIKAAKEGIDLNGCSLFVNLLPCPPCSRMLSETSISELVYIDDHSDGYAVKLLEKSGKTVKRVTTATLGGKP